MQNAGRRTPKKLLDNFDPKTPFSGEKGLGSINSLPNFLSCIVLAAIIYSLALLTGRQRNEAGSPKRGEASLSKKDAPLGYDTYPSDSKETVERSGN